MIKIYRDFLNQLNKHSINDYSLTKVTRDKINKYPVSLLNNIYIYVNLKRSKTITITNSTEQEFVYGSTSNVDNKYFLFYPNIYLNDYYTLLITNCDFDCINLCIYNEHFLFKERFLIKELKSFLEWVNIDELTSKVNEACEYISTTLQMIDNIKLCQVDRLSDFISRPIQGSELFHEMNEYYRLTLNQSRRKKKTYDELYVYKEGKIYRKCFINCYDKHKYVFNELPEGEAYTSYIYFSIDNRSILLRCQTFSPTFTFFKNGKITNEFTIFDCKRLKGLFYLLSRTDIYDFLKKIHFLADDSWKKFIDESIKPL